MISFQHIKSGRYLASRSDFSHSAMLSDAYPFHPVDENPMREKFPALAQYRTVNYSSRIDHPENDISKLSKQEIAQRYPIAR